MESSSNCEQCGEPYTPTPETHGNFTSAELGALILLGFCSKTCENRWFFEDQMAQIHREVVEGA